MTAEAVPVAEADPFLDIFTAEEERMALAIRGEGAKAVTLGQVAAAIGAGFLLYRFWMWRRMKEELLRSQVAPTPNSLYELNSKLFRSVWARVAWTMVPAIASGYAVGLKDVVQQNYSRAWMASAAEEYAIALAENLHDTSAEALIEGYQSQLNRNLAARKAADAAIDAFGVTPRTMRALVNLWSAPTEATLTSREMPKKAKARADHLISQAIAERAKVIGQTEAYAAKNNAKSIVWLYLKQEGQLPADATKMWVTADDEKTCPICAPLHHTQVLLDEKFPTAQGDVWAPSLHPNCRCDIVLRGVAQVYDSGEYLEEMAPRELEVAKSAWGVVSKAKGGDQYDRDKSGKFSSTESRGGRVQVRRTGVVRGQLDQERAAQIAASNRKAQEEARQNATLLTDRERAEVAAAYQKLAAKLKSVDMTTSEVDMSQGVIDMSVGQQIDMTSQAQVDMNAQVDMSAQQVDVTAQQVSIAAQQVKFEMPQLSIEMPTETQIRMQAPPVADDVPSDKWEVNPGGDVLYGLFTNVGHPLHYGGDDENSVVLADDRTMFYTSQKALKDGIHEHWEEVLWEDLSERFQNESTYDDDYPYDDPDTAEEYDETFDAGVYVPGHITVPVGSLGRNHTVKVDFDTYRQAFAASLPGNDERYNRWVTVERADQERVHGVEDIPMNDLIVALGAGKFIEEHMPMIGVTSWINVQQSNEYGHMGARTNPGKWAIKYPYKGGSLSYDMNFIDPDDLFEDAPETSEIVDLPWDEIRSPFD